jgi:hypothetical protein
MDAATTAARAVLSYAAQARDAFVDMLVAAGWVLAACDLWVDPVSGNPYPFWRACVIAEADARRVVAGVPRPGHGRDAAQADQEVAGEESKAGQGGGAHGLSVRLDTQAMESP